MKYLAILLLVFTMGCGGVDRGEELDHVYGGTVIDVQYDNKLTRRWQGDPYMIIKSSKGMFYSLNTVAPIAIGDDIVESSYANGDMLLRWGNGLVNLEEGKIIFENNRNRTMVDGKSLSVGYWVRN